MNKECKIGTLHAQQYDILPMCAYVENTHIVSLFLCFIKTKQIKKKLPFMQR